MLDEIDTRQVILQAAEELFMRHGYASVSMRRLADEIAKRRRITKPAIYYHFADKEALYVAVLLHVTARSGQQLRVAAAKAGDLRLRLVALAKVLAQLDPQALTRMQLDIAQHVGSAARAELYSAFQRDIRGPILAVFDEAATGGVLRADRSSALAASAFLGLVSSIIARSGQEQQDDAAALAVDVLLEGVARA